MLGRTVKPCCDGLHDVAKQLLIWAFRGKRTIGTRESDDYYESRLAYGRKRFSRQRFEPSSFPNLKSFDWKTEDLTPFTKNIYNPSSDAIERNKEEVDNFLKKNDIKLYGKDCPAPIFDFKEAGLSDKIMGVIRDLNFQEPTPIQCQGIPIALSGRNMVGIAQTGSGKTLAFILPAIMHIQHQAESDGRGPIALVVGPTRELVQQIRKMADPFLAVSKLRSASLYGGSDRDFQRNILERPLHICMATPGRLLDFLNEGIADLSRCTYLVLDEADRMFDMGFEPQIRSIIQQIRPDRQILMWSATWPEEIRNLAAEHLGDFIMLSIGSLSLRANPNIEQKVHVCHVKEKVKVLLKILEEIKKDGNSKILIFTQTRNAADKLSYWLSARGFHSSSMHSRKSQRQREYCLEGFRKGRIPILIATDVAARGLDVSDISHVINFDYPSTTEDYIHRIGRTARHTAKGTAHTLVTEDEAFQAQTLIKILKEANQPVPDELIQLTDNIFQSGSRQYPYFVPKH